MQNAVGPACDIRKGLGLIEILASPPGESAHLDMWRKQRGKAPRNIAIAGN